MGINQFRALVMGSTGTSSRCYWMSPFDLYEALMRSNSKFQEGEPGDASMLVGDGDIGGIRRPNCLAK